MWREAKSIRIFGIDADHVSDVSHHRVTAAKGLHQAHLGPGRKTMRNPAGNLRGVNFTRQLDLFVGCHELYSVETAS